MKRFSYILAALLAGGATSALTSCIDTTEPAGITELRGAKAMLLKAKAAFIDAKTQREAVYLEQDKVQLESQKVDLELKKLNLELQKTLNAIKNDSANMAHKLYLETIQKKRDSLALRAEEDWWKVQKDITTAEQNYKKAVIDLQVALLTYKDDQIADKINKYTEILYGADWNKPDEGSTTTNVLSGGLYALLNQANLDLLEKQREKILFSAHKDDYTNTLILKKTEKENILKIQQDLLGQMKALSEKFAQDSLQAVKERLIEIDAELDALADQKLDLYNEAQKIKQTTLAGISQKVAEYEQILDTDTTIVVDVVDEKLQNDLGAYCTSNYIYEDNFKLNADGKYEMVAPIELEAKLKNQKNSSALAGIQSGVQSIFQGQYVAAYNKYMGSGKSASDLFENDGTTVKAAYATQLQHEVERLEMDKDKVRKVYDDAVAKWLKTYEVFDKALTAYEAYKDPSASYDAAEKAIQKYLEDTRSLSTADADEKAKFLKLSQDLRTELNKYYTLRAPIDSVSSAYRTFKENYIDKDAAGKDQLTDDPTVLTGFRNAVNSTTGYEAYYSILGQKDFENYYYNTNDKGALPEFLAAERDLFGTYNSTLAKALQPVKTDKGYVAPEGLDAKTYDYTLNSYDGSVDDQKYDEIADDSKFMKAALTYNQPAILTTLADWVKLYEKIGGQIEEVNDRVDALVEAKKALVNDNKDAFTALWEKEIECYLIDAEYEFDADGDGTLDQVFSSDNPYYEYYIAKTESDLGTDDNDVNIDFVAPPATSKKDALEAEKAVLENYSTTSSVTYVIYDEEKQKYVETSGRWEVLIAQQESVVKTAKEAVDNIQQRLDLLEKLGYIEYDTNGKPVITGDVNIPDDVSSTDQFMEKIDEEIAQAEDKIKVLQAEFDRIQTKIQDLIKVAEDPNFGSSDATYPGFGVDNDPIEVPGTEDPEPENPEPENPEPENPEPENPDAEKPAE